MNRNECYHCPLQQMCDDKIETHETYVHKLEDAIQGYIEQELDVDFEIEDKKRTLPKNWLKRLFTKDNISTLQTRRFSISEYAQDYHAAQVRRQEQIAELQKVKQQAPETCVGPALTASGARVCTSELNTKQNLRLP